MLNSTLLATTNKKTNNIYCILFKYPIAKIKEH